MAETKAKGMAQRIPLDYYKRPDSILRWKRVLAALALVLTVGWWASGLEFRGNRIETSSRGSLRSSKGPLASVHQAWNDKCEACHRPFTAVDGTRWSPPLFSTGRESDTSCKTCHNGPEHSTVQREQDVKSCGGCHVDHQGQDFSLVRLNDQECTSCHTDLKSHRVADAKPLAIADVIHSFATDHPKFSSEVAGATDPGRLKFNHSLHMNPGLVKNPDDRSIKTLAYIQDPAARERYRIRDQKDNTPIQLDCNSCHVTDAGDFKIAQLAGLPTSATLPPRGSGKEMLAITYENQCKACHPLTFDTLKPDLVAPHRVQPKAINQFLWSTYAGILVQNDAKLLSKVPRARAIPGIAPDADVQNVKQQIEQAVTAAEKVLYSGKTTCLECHNATKVADNGRLESIVVPNVPAIWLPKSRFDHTAHRGVGCRDCHTGAKDSKVATDILIPGIESCRECHSPAQSTGYFASTAPPKGGVRHDCTACHRYHHGDKPLQGRGARDEMGTARDFAQFLNGSSQPQSEAK